MTENTQATTTKTRPRRTIREAWINWTGGWFDGDGFGSQGFSFGGDGGCGDGGGG